MNNLKKLFCGGIIIAAVFALANFAQARTWEQVGSEGLGNTNNKGFFGFEQLIGSLFVGTYNTSGAQAFSSADGINWIAQNDNGFGDINNISYHGGHATFNNYLYFCSYNPVTGTEVWRTPTTGVLQATQVNNDGFGQITNSICYAMKEFKGVLYTVTGAVQGRLYVSSNGTTWSQFGADGFGDANNIGFLSLEVLGDYLYLGTWNAVTGGELWRSVDGTTWTQVNTDGFGNSANIQISALKTFDNYLYAATTNANGTEIWKSSDSTTWSKTGFSSAVDSAIQGMYVAENTLFAGTINISSGAAVFETTDGETWTQNNTGGFGVGGTNGHVTIRDFGMLGEYLYVGANRGFWAGAGGSIWRTDIVAPTITASPTSQVSRSKITVTLSNNDSSAIIYYTMDNSTPTAASTQYTSPMSLTRTTNLKFVAIDSAGNTSEVGNEVYVVTPYPYLYQANKFLQKYKKEVIFRNTSDGQKAGLKFKPFAKDFEIFSVGDPDYDNKAEILVGNQNKIKVYNSKAKREYTLAQGADHLWVGDIDNNKKDETLVAQDKVLKIYKKKKMLASFSFAEKIKDVAVGRTMKANKPLVILGFNNEIKFYQYKNKKLKLQKTKKVKYTSFMSYDMDHDRLDELIYARGKMVYVVDKNFKKKFSVKAQGFLSAADINGDYGLEIIATTGKRMKIFDHEGKLILNDKAKGKWLGVNFN